MAEIDLAYKLAGGLGEDGNIATLDYSAVSDGDAAGDLVALVHLGGLRGAVGVHVAAANDCNRTEIYLGDIGIGDRRRDANIAGLNLTGVRDGDAAGDLVALTCLSGLCEVIGVHVAAAIERNRDGIRLCNPRISDRSGDASVTGVDAAAILDGDTAGDFAALMRLG